MARLIEELKRQHVAIVETLNKVNELGIASREGRDKLMAAKAGLLAHLAKEDAELYPVLGKAAEADEALRRTLRLYADDMAGISKFALGFFEKYAGGGSGIEFAQDFGTLFATLKSRVMKEESVLYKAYERVHPD